MADDFADRIAKLRASLARQGQRVQHLLEETFRAVVVGDVDAAARAVASDDEIDAADVELERAAVALLADATRQGAQLDPALLRSVLTIVKVNNEFERVADAATDVASLVEPMRRVSLVFPDTFRVMANSVVGILRDVTSAVSRADPGLARVVLQSQHAVTAFKDAILRGAEEQIAARTMRVDGAFLLHEVAGQCEIMADHCANVAEQVIYETTGTIVRHTDTRWIDLPPPRDA